MLNPASYLAIQYQYLTTAKPAFRFLYAIAFCSLLMLFSITPFFLEFIQQRQEVVLLNDPLLALFHPLSMNLSFIIIPLTYIPIFLTLTWLMNYPKQLLSAIIAYLFILVTRFTCLYLLPLAAPIDTVPLYDPITYGHHLITKDLFFSGHISILVLCCLAVKNKLLFRIILSMSFLVLLALLLQHSHYIIDLFIAPYVSVTCYYLATLLCHKLE